MLIDLGMEAFDLLALLTGLGVGIGIGGADV